MGDRSWGMEAFSWGRRRARLSVVGGRRLRGIDGIYLLTTSAIREIHWTQQENGAWNNIPGTLRRTSWEPPPRSITKVRAVVNKQGQGDDGSQQGSSSGRFEGCWRPSASGSICAVRSYVESVLGKFKGLSRYPLS